MKIYKLDDKIVGCTLSYHDTVESAMVALGKTIQGLAFALNRDYSEDDRVNFELRYSVTSVKVLSLKAAE